MNETADVTSLMSREELRIALRETNVDQERFDHRCWSIRDAQTFETIAQLIREGYANGEAKVECSL